MYSSLIEKLRYNSEDGNLYWSENIGDKVRFGNLAGGLDKDGYRIIHYQHKAYKCHRIVWSLHNGLVDSFGNIDHINGNRSDNRIENLRVCSQRDNTRNQKIHRAGRLYGSQKIYTRKDKAFVWHSRIVVNKEQLNLGYYQSEEEGHLIYLMASAFYGVTPCI